jgi:hypothetical protein
VSWGERRRNKKEEGRRELDLQRRKKKEGGNLKRGRRRKKKKRGGTYSKARERKKIKKKQKDAWRNITDEGKKKKYINDNFCRAKFVPEKC